MADNSVITDLVDSLRARHPSREVESFVSTFLFDQPTAVVILKFRCNAGWWESPLMLLPDITPKQMEEAKDIILEWEVEFEKATKEILNG